MVISEKQLKELVMRVLKELESEKKKSVFMVCTSEWDERYPEFLKLTERSGSVQVYPVIPASWEKNGYEAALRSYQSCHGIVYHSCEKPQDMEHAVTVFPVVLRDVIVKTALCISDTFETSWIASCFEKGCRVIFLRSGLVKFTGREPKSYINQILTYYRQILEYGIEISDGNGLSETWDHKVSLQPVPLQPAQEIHNKNRVITASNIEQYASAGILYRQKGDVVTDLAKDRAKFLNIVFK